MLSLNAIERAIAGFSPEWGVRRLAAKSALETALGHARGFDAARRDRRTSSWLAGGGSANAEIRPALELVRKRSRDLIRNNEWAGNARRKLTAHIVGTGIMPRPDVEKSRSSKKLARDLWNAFSDNCAPDGLHDYYGIQEQVIGEVIEGGAAFIRWYKRPPEWNLKVPLQCEVLEHDFLDIQRTEMRGDNVIVNGVEYDSYGRRVAYWLFPIHPGEVTILSRGAFQSQRVSADDVDHVFRVDRPGQVTGVPWLAVTALRLRDTGDYEEAELVRKKIEACLTVFVKRNGGGPSTIVQQAKLAQAGQQSTDDKNRRLEKIAPGLIAYLDNDEDISTATPTPSAGYGDYMHRQMLAAAAGIGLPHASLTGDGSQVNFSSLRELKLDFWQVLDQWQWLMTVPQVCRPTWRRVMRTSAARGYAISADMRADWTPPKRPWVDPLKDAKAEEMELSLGLDSWSEKVAARGYDPDEHLAALTEERKKLAEAGITFGQTPGMQEVDDAPEESKTKSKTKS